MADHWLQRAAEQARPHRPFGAQLALLLLAHQGEQCPLIGLSKGDPATIR
jgi:hypothetical protein